MPSLRNEMVGGARAESTLHNAIMATAASLLDRPGLWFFGPALLYWSCPEYRVRALGA